MALSPAPSMMVKKLKILRYYFVEGFVEKQKAYIAEHLVLAKEYEHSGKLLLGGPLSSPFDGEIFIFQDLLNEDIEAYVQRDAFYKNSLIFKYDIQDWEASFGRWLNPWHEIDEA